MQEKNVFSRWFSKQDTESFQFKYKWNTVYNDAGETCKHASLSQVGAINRFDEGIKEDNNTV